MRKRNRKDSRHPYRCDECGVSADITEKRCARIFADSPTELEIHRCLKCNRILVKVDGKWFDHVPAKHDAIDASACNCSRTFYMIKNRRHRRRIR